MVLRGTKFKFFFFIVLRYQNGKRFLKSLYVSLVTMQIVFRVDYRVIWNIIKVTNSVMTLTLSSAKNCFFQAIIYRCFQI